MAASRAGRLRRGEGGRGGEQQQSISRLLFPCISSEKANVCEKCEEQNEEGKGQARAEPGAGGLGGAGRDGAGQGGTEQGEAGRG